MINRPLNRTSNQVKINDMKKNETNTIYDVSYFIDKFEKIPESKWFTGALRDLNDTARCALGHCLGSKIQPYFNGYFQENEETTTLSKLIVKYLKIDTAHINDNNDDRYPQPTPRARILAALYDIKAMQEPATNPYQIDLTRQLAVLPSDRREVDLLPSPPNPVVTTLVTNLK